MPLCPSCPAETEDLFDRIGHAALARQQQPLRWRFQLRLVSFACGSQDSASARLYGMPSDEQRFDRGTRRSQKKQSKITLYFCLWPSQKRWDLTLFNHQKRLLSFFHRLRSHGAVIEDFAKRLVPRLTARDLANLTWSFAAAKLTHEFLKHVVDSERWNRRAGFEKHELHRQPVRN